MVMLWLLLQLLSAREKLCYGRCASPERRNLFAFPTAPWVSFPGFSELWEEWDNWHHKHEQQDQGPYIILLIYEDSKFAFHVINVKWIHKWLNVYTFSPIRLFFVTSDFKWLLWYQLISICLSVICFYSDADKTFHTTFLFFRLVPFHVLPIIAIWERLRNWKREENLVSCWPPVSLAIMCLHHSSSSYVTVTAVESINSLQLFTGVTSIAPSFLSGTPAPWAGNSSSKAWFSSNSHTPVVNGHDPLLRAQSFSCAHPVLQAPTF